MAMCLWQRDNVTGNWILIRCVQASHAEAWKRMYQKAHPREVFAISAKKPGRALGVRRLVKGGKGNPDLRRLLRAS